MWHRLAPLVAFLAASSAMLAAEADALAIDRNLQARHLPFGTVVDPIFAGPTSDQIVGYTRCGDSAIWTGHYLAAESFRYKVTTSPEALANVKSALNGLKTLVDVTGIDLLARCAVPLNSPYAASIASEEQNNGIYRNSALNLQWVGHTSRDQYSGVFFGLAVAYDYVDDTTVKTSAKNLVTRMLTNLRSHDWIVVMPDGTPSTTFIGRADQQLSFLQVGRHVNPDVFSTAYDTNRILLAASVLAPIALETTSDSSYFKFNLDYINLYDLVRLETSPIGSVVYAPAYAALRSHTEGHQNAFFNMIDRALTGPNADREAQTVLYLNQWLQRPRRDITVNLRGIIPSCGDADTACNPIPIPQRVPTDFLWQRSPFQLAGGGSGLIESAGIDYLLPYWMARYYNVAVDGSVIPTPNAANIVSAASGVAALAPESIASFYGTNLAPGIATATTLPLPTTLGGVSVQVQDSTGITRLAPLFYVSPTQINFQVPAGTAAGQTKITLTNGGATGTTALKATAPSLFTANATGTGVVAATAIRVGVNGQQSSVPVFQCTTAGGCTPVPIQLGVDTPVYLTLYATGVRGRSSLNNVSVTVRGLSLPVQYAGPQGSFVGLDQVNVLVPLTLRNAGESDLILTVDGQAANPVRINIQ